MHTTEVGAGTVPAFLAKLWRLVEDESSKELISWTPSGTSFIIMDQAKFAKDVLPLYFKHNNMASFIRQLNMYGFRKVTSLDQGSLRFESDSMEFQHQYFLKDHEYLLELIKRKVTPGKPAPSEEVKVKPEILNRVLVDVKHLRNKQENVDSKLAGMKRENEALWREVASLRQKHTKQQQIVNKLIQFLLTFVQPNRGMGHKRKIPLMINDTVHIPSRQISYEMKKTDEPVIKNPAEADREMCESGPIIHDVTDVVDPSQLLDVEILSPEVNYTFDVTSPQETAATPASKNEILAPSELPNSISSPFGAVDVTDTIFSPVEDLLNSANGDEALPPSSSLELTDILVPMSDKNLNKTDFIDHIDNMQTELDSIKEMLSSTGCTIDASTLLEAMLNLRPLYDGLADQSPSAAEFFLADDALSKGTTEMTNADKGPGNEIMGMELTQYHPNLLELTEDDTTFFDPENENASNVEDQLFDFNMDTILPDDPALFGVATESTAPQTSVASTSNMPPAAKKRKT